LTYAEVKAIASGNPLVIEKAKVDSEVMRLNRLRSQHSETLFITRNSIRRAQEDIPRLEQKITNIQADLGIRQNTKGDAFTITIENRLYQNREDAGSALNRLTEKHHLSAKLVEVGEFAGFGLQLWPERVKEVVLRGKNAYVANISDASLGTISSLEHVVRSLDERMNEYRNDLAQTKHRLEELQPHAHKPFEHEEKLSSLIQRQQEIMHTLDLTKNQASNSLAAEPTPVVEESVQEGQSITHAHKERPKLTV
jgi:TolA-binding protein